MIVDTYTFVLPTVSLLSSVIKPDLSLSFLLNKLLILCRNPGLLYKYLPKLHSDCKEIKTTAATKIGRYAFEGS